MRSISRALRSARLRCRRRVPGSAPGHRASLIASPLAPSGWTARNASSSRALRSPVPISRPAAVICRGPSTLIWTGVPAGPGPVPCPAAPAGGGCCAGRRGAVTWPGPGAAVGAGQVRLPCFRRAGCGRAVIAGGLAGLVQLRDDRGEVGGFEVVGLGPGKARLRRRDAADQAAGGDVAGGAVRPVAEQDDGDAEIAAGGGDAGQPLRGGGAGAAASTTATACGPSSPSAVRARRTIMASASSSAASSAGGTRTPRMGG